MLLNIMFCCICSSFGNFIVCSDYFFAHLALVFRERNKGAVDETYFCPHTFEIFFDLPEKDKNALLFVYKFDSFLYRVNKMSLACCFACHETVVKKHNLQIGCFIRYFPEKESP